MKQFLNKFVSVRSLKTASSSDEHYFVRLNDEGALLNPGLGYKLKSMIEELQCAT
jgi:hypothetical protein